MPYLKPGLVSSVDIEEIAPRRNYRLAYIFGCMSCQNTSYETLPVTIFLFRTEKDLRLMKNNIYQRCVLNHITRPHKKCTKCNKEHSVDDIVCMECETIVADIAKWEVLIEERLKDAAKLEKQFKRKKIQQMEYTERLYRYNDDIREAQIELAKIEEVEKKKHG